MAKPPSTAKPAIPARAAKVFSIAPWSDAKEGQKIVLYGKSGIGKTTLAAMAPGATFIGLDDGGRKISNPKTRQPVNAIKDVFDYLDVREAVQQCISLIPEGGTLVLDTITKLEEVAGAHILNTVRTEKGASANNLLAYGWGNGFRHVDDHVRLVLTDFDPLIRAGRNVILLAQLAQARIANAEGSDYLEDGPALYHSNAVSIRNGVCAWADHVLRIGYQDMQVSKENVNARAGKVSGDTIRCVFSGGALHYVAKAREISGKRLPGVISFATPDDDSLWQMVFQGAIPE